MNRTLVCYKIEGKLFIYAKKDFKEIRFLHGFENVIKLDEKFCTSNKIEIDYEKKCRKKYS
jgi:hypothetical protein